MLIMSRKYFAQSLELRIKGNTRALYGMLGVTARPQHLPPTSAFSRSVSALK